MKHLFLLLFVFSPLLRVYPEAKKPLNARVAVYDYNEIMRAVGSDQLRLLHADAEIKEALREIHVENQKLHDLILKEKDSEKLKEYKNQRYQLRERREMVMSLITTERGGRNFNDTLKDFLIENYAKKYDVILSTSSVRMNPHSGGVIADPTQLEDITKRVIQDIRDQNK